MYHEFCGAFEHEADENDDVQAREGFGVALVVLDEPSASRRPSERSFDNPSFGEQYKALFRLGQFD